jgi:3-oxoacyl-[acyl-carrier protein] reductase
MLNGTLQGKTALVCGASKGIGLAVAEALAHMGAKVVALARDEKALKAAIGKLPGKGHGVWVQDLSDLVSLRANIQEHLSHFGEFHILVNNAGGPKSGPLINASQEDLVIGFQTHVLASHILTQALVPGMRHQGFGRIINILSTSVKIPILNLGVSNTVRAAMANWAKTLSLELAPYGITVNNILPGFTKTDRLIVLQRATAERQNCDPEEIEKLWLNSIPCGRFAEPGETAQAVAFLASPLASYINGINLPVDGGRTGSL